MWIVQYEPRANELEGASETVPTALLTRARDVALEHRQLTDKLSDGFDTRAAKKLGEYGPIVSALGAWDKASEVSSGVGGWQERPAILIVLSR
jgi:peptide chain release factor 1